MLKSQEWLFFNGLAPNLKILVVSKTDNEGLPNYLVFSPNFYERYMGGEDIKAGWVNESDFEKDFREKE